jgi:hypothetical protein
MKKEAYITKGLLSRFRLHGWHFCGNDTFAKGRYCIKRIGRKWYWVNGNNY